MSGAGPEEMRPPLSPGMSAAEFARWYWLKRELEPFARRLGVSAAGGKAEIAARISARLSGEPDPAGAAPRGVRERFAGDLTPETPIPRDPPLDARLRAYMTGACGPGFRFDGHMRAFFRDGQGRTLAEAADHWRGTRSLPLGEIARQFEYNRFAREWRSANPGAAHAALAAAWSERKRRPAEPDREQRHGAGKGGGDGAPPARRGQPQ
ncbi:MAG: DUF6434 domain-containing protein [Chloroflexota bacterium]